MTFFNINSLLIKHPVLQKIISNVSWLLFDKVLKMAVGLVVIVWLARYLGPEQFGLLNFVLALVMIFSIFANFGLGNVVVRDIVKEPAAANQILGSTFFIRFIAAIFSYGLLLLMVFILRPEDNLSKFLTAIIGLSLLFKTADTIRLWFEAETKSKYIVWGEGVGFLISSVIKVVLLWQEASIIAFGFAILFESVILAFILIFIYSKVESSLTQWEISKARVWNLLVESWPLIIATAAGVIYTRIDILMIGQMLDDKAVGYYSAATRLSDFTNFLPMIIVASVMPSVIGHRLSNADVYKKHFQLTYDVAIGGMVILAIVTMFLSDWIVHLLYGDLYMQASGVLAIHIWTAVIIAMSIVGGRYLISEGLQKIILYRQIFGVFINIPLNFLMIPKFGIEGAAMATLISFIISSYIFDLFTKHTWICFRQKTNALIFKSTWFYLLSTFKKTK